MPANDSTNRANFSTILDTIYAHINDPDEKVPQSNAWGDLWWDAYNYLSGQITREESGLNSAAGELLDTIEGWAEQLHQREHGRGNGNASRGLVA